MWRFDLARYTTFAISVDAVGVYYGILAIWFWNMIPTQLADG